MGTVPPTSTPAPSSPGGPAEEFVGQHPDHAGRQELPRSGVEASGQALPVSDAEWAARQAWLTRTLTEIDAEDDTLEDVYDQFRRNLDDERRRVGRPPAFEGTA
jgi:hypothetical protein